MKRNTEKLAPKSTVKLRLSLTEDQKKAKALVLDSTIAVLTGDAGTSKSFLACQIALSEFLARKIDVISFSRPMVGVENKDMGAMPGTLQEKFEPWCLPLIDNMYKLHGKENVDKMIEKGEIIFRPLQFIRGITFDNEIAILDEAQNATQSQILAFLTRLGYGSRVILTGDTGQIDLKNGAGLERLVEIVPDIEEMVHVEMKKNYRHPVVRKIIDNYK